MIIRTLVAAGLASGLVISAANAMTVVNADTSSHNVVFTPKGGHARHYAVAAHHQRSIDCKSGGKLGIGKSTQSCDAMTAKITIKYGKFAM